MLEKKKEPTPPNPATVDWSKKTQIERLNHAMSMAGATQKVLGEYLDIVQAGVSSGLIYRMKEKDGIISNLWLNNPRFNDFLAAFHISREFILKGVGRWHTGTRVDEASELRKELEDVKMRLDIARKKYSDLLEKNAEQNAVKDQTIRILVEENQRLKEEIKKGAAG